MNKKWIGKTIDNNQIAEIKEKYAKNIVISGLVSNRFNKDYEGVFEMEKISFSDPFEIPDMDIAVDRILEAIENEEQILVYGDYDADGVTSTTILYQFLKEQNAFVSYYIPNRIKEGYGLNNARIEEFKKMGYSLIITVDNGIASVKEAIFAKQIGIDLIITDHHEVQNDEIPEAIAVVNPKRSDCKLKFKEIAGCFVAYKLVIAISESIGLTKSEYEKYIPLVAVGTIADVMPLKQENRKIVNIGIKMMKSNEISNFGLKILLSKLEKITSTNIAFFLVPILNSPGRLAEDLAVTFLTVDSEAEAKKLYEDLLILNEKRKQLVVEISKKVEEKIEALRLYEHNVIIVDGKYHEGIVGIVAAKMMEKYAKPVILLSKEENEYKGSRKSRFYS